MLKATRKVTRKSAYPKTNTLSNKKTFAKKRGLEISLFPCPPLFQFPFKPERRALILSSPAIVNDLKKLTLDRTASAVQKFAHKIPPPPPFFKGGNGGDLSRECRSYNANFLLAFTVVLFDSSECGRHAEGSGMDKRTMNGFRSRFDRQCLGKSGLRISRANPHVHAGLDVVDSSRLFLVYQLHESLTPQYLPSVSGCIFHPLKGAVKI